MKATNLDLTRISYRLRTAARRVLWEIPDKPITSTKLLKMYGPIVFAGFCLPPVMLTILRQHLSHLQIEWTLSLFVDVALAIIISPLPLALLAGIVFLLVEVLHSKSAGKLSAFLKGISLTYFWSGLLYLTASGAIVIIYIFPDIRSWYLGFVGIAASFFLSRGIVVHKDVSTSAPGGIIIGALVASVIEKGLGAIEAITFFIFYYSSLVAFSTGNPLRVVEEVLSTISFVLMKAHSERFSIFLMPIHSFVDTEQPGLPGMHSAIIDLHQRRPDVARSLLLHAVYCGNHRRDALKTLFQIEMAELRAISQRRSGETHSLATDRSEFAPIVQCKRLLSLTHAPSESGYGSLPSHLLSNRVRSLWLQALDAEPLKERNELQEFIYCTYVHREMRK